MAENIERKFDLSGGIQSATTWLQRKANELEDAYNVVFHKYLGAATRRNGYVKEGSAMSATKRSNGLHEAKFSNGAKTFVAHNNSGDTATIMEWYQKSAGSTWTTLSMPNAIDPNTRISMNDSLGEMYVCGKSTTTGGRVQIVNVKNDLSVSTTRNLYGAPKARFVVEYGGALYAINVDINGTVYSDRAYRSSQALGAVTFVQGYQAFSTTNITVKVDSVQYLKPSMVLDVYKAGTETKAYDSLTIISVDKNLGTITFAAQTTSSNNASANTSTDQILVTSSTLFPTGQPFQMSGGTLPTGLSAGTTYYAINIDATHIQAATSYSNALLGVPVDITIAGSSTATVYQGMADNDEFWLHGRKNELAYFWNLDYPTVDQADFLRIIPGTSSDSEIIAYAKSNNRLFLFTKTAVFKWDNANLVPVFEDVGCINQDSIVNLGDWLIWVDASGRIQARNDSTGQHEIISRGIKNNWLNLITQAMMLDASAGRSGDENVYKLCVGTVNNQVWQLNYDFDSNTWTRDILTKTVTNRLVSDMNGLNMRTYFTDTAGQMWLDEEGNLDDTDTIPMYIKLGRDNAGTDFMKDANGFYVYGNNVAGTSVKFQAGDNDPVDLAQLTGDVTRVPVKNNVQSQGRYYTLEFTNNSKGDAPSIEGISPYLDEIEDGFK